MLCVGYREFQKEPDGTNLTKFNLGTHTYVYVHVYTYIGYNVHKDRFLVSVWNAILRVLLRKSEIQFVCLRAPEPMMQGVRGDQE